MAAMKISALQKKAGQAMREAFVKVVEEHKRLGLPLYMWKDGKVIAVEAKKVKLS